MGILADVLALKQQERQDELADINSIGTAVNNFVDLRQQAQQRQRQRQIDDLNRRNIESQIEARKSNNLDDLSNFLDIASDAKAINNEPLFQAANERISGLLNQASSQEIKKVTSKAVGKQLSQPSDVSSVDDFISPEINIFGDLTEKGKLQKKQAESQIAIGKQVEAKRQKDQLETEQGLRNAEFKIDNTLDSFLDVAERTMELTGAKPGVLSGTITSVLGRTRQNEFFQGFKGGLVEFAAAIGRIAIPGARAVRLVNLFKSTAPSTFDTIESGVQTSADSFRNAISSDMANNPKEYLTDEEEKLSKQKQTELLKDKLRSFEQQFRLGALKRVYLRNPDLLKEDTQIEIEKNLTVEELQGLVR